MATKKKAGPASARRTPPPAPPPPSADPTSTSSERHSCPPVAAVGASPAAMPAVKALLAALPADTGLAVLVLVDRDADRDAWLEALGAAARAPVAAAVAGQSIEPDHVYFVPAETPLVVESGLFAPAATASSHAIDAMMRALATDCRGAAVGVLLGGDRTEGLLGLEAIKSEGGFTFAQSDAPPELAIMPRTAVASGCVDFSLPPGGIATELCALSAALRQVAASVDRAPSEVTDDLQHVFRLLRQARGVDFSGYRQTTIRRRVARRMLLQRLQSLREYQRYLREHPEEVDALFHDMLIRVTSFFRDPKVFDVLKERVFPKMLVDPSVDRPARIWVPGCATGEEAYSLAIAALEYGESVRARVTLQIFATDVSEPSIERARAGIYPETVALDVSEERIRRFFARTERGYQVDKMIRDMCVFARQNVTSDPPFSRVDLISCRNLLIYLEPALQKRVMPTFHYALKPGGFLLLGSSETVGAGSELFSPIDKGAKLYSKVAVAVPPALEFGSGAGGPRTPVNPVARADEPPPIVDVEREADRAILSRFAPVGVVVNDDYHIVQFRGHTGAYLEPAPGEASLHLLKMAREGLLIELRATLHRAQATGDVARSGVLSVRSNGGYKDVIVQVVPLRAGGRSRHYLVLFEEVPDKGEPRSRPAANVQPPDVERLQQELASTREYLQSIIEEQEATNEELQSANEEILSSNEELQSINEELETAKEELQSTNEELTTVNEELQKRNVELVQVNNDLYNSLASVNMPIVMLSSDLRIRRFTPMAERVLHLIPTDVGRPISDIRPKIEVPDFDRLIRDVVRTRQVQEREVRDQDGHWYTMRILPYQTTDGRTDGAVLCLIDIDPLKQARGEQAGWRRHAAELVQQLPMPLLFVDPALRVVTTNGAFTNFFRVDPSEISGRYIYDLGRVWSLPSLRTVLEELLAKGSGQLDYVLLDGDGDGRAKSYRLRAAHMGNDGDGKLLAIWLLPPELAKAARLLETDGDGK